MSGRVVGTKRIGRERIERLMGAAFIGTAPGQRTKARQARLARSVNRDAKKDDRYAALAAELQKLQALRSLKTFALYAMNVNENSAAVAANLAIALAECGESVCLCETDIDDPTIPRLFNLDKQPGLTDIAEGESAESGLEHVLEAELLSPEEKTGFTDARVSLLEALQATYLKNLLLLTAGGAEVSGQMGDRVRRIITVLRSRFDVVLVAMSEVAPFLEGIDGVLVIIDAQNQDSTALEEMRGRIEKAGSFVAGLLLQSA